MSYDNTNRGTLFRNDRKETDRHPDYTGRININGTDHWLSAWIKEAGPNARNPGQKFMSLSIGDECQRQSPPPASNPSQGSFDEDDIPF